MTMTYSLNRSPRRLCEEMEPFIPPVEGERLVRRPFNHYTPALTDWWIVPSLDLPFFKFGKYFFSWDVKQRTSLQCGLSLTKGLDPMLAAVYPSRKGRRLLMDESWAWNRFRAAVEKGEFEEKLRGAAATVKWSDLYGNPVAWPPAGQELLYAEFPKENTAFSALFRTRQE